MAENIPNLRRDLDIEVHEANRSCQNFNPRRSSPKHIVRKLKSKTEFWQQERKNSLIKGNLHQAISGREVADQRRMGCYIQSAERKELSTKILYPAKLSLRNEGQIKTFPNKQKLREFIINKLALQEMLKGVLQAEMKG